MITTVTLNPAIDKVVEIDNMELGKVHRIGEQTVSFGGKSVNVARLLSGFNCETSAVCYLGKTNYQEVKEMADHDGITLDTIMLEGTTRTNVKVVEPDMEYRTTDLNEAGFSVSEKELEEMVTLITEQAKKSDCIVLSGSLPKGVSKSFYKEMAVKLSEYTKVIIDADDEVLQLAMEGGPFMIKPNNHELEAATGIEAKTEEDIVKLARVLIEKYNITYVLVSRGADGSVLVGRDCVLSAGVLPVKVVSTVGAGDSMLAGMIYGLSESGGFSIENVEKLSKVEVLKKALAYGVAASSIAISTQEHKVIEAKELKAVAKKVSICEL